MQELKLGKRLRFKNPVPLGLDMGKKRLVQKPGMPLVCNMDSREKSYVVDSAYAVPTAQGYVDHLFSTHIPSLTGLFSTCIMISLRFSYVVPMVQIASTTELTL